MALAIGVVTTNFNLYAQTAIPYCYSASADSDGDGWGWENNRTCIVFGSSSDPANPFGSCRSAQSDPDGDGFGWEDGRTCTVTSNQQNNQQQESQFAPCRSSDSDPDGDGFGWEDGKTCSVGSVGQNSEEKDSQFAACRSAYSDPDGDGFGWEDGKTCSVGSAGQNSEEKGTQFAACRSANSDPDGDGFGWEDGKTCSVGSVGQNSEEKDSQFAACRSANSDPDGDGYGWEDGKTCTAINGGQGQFSTCRSSQSDPDGDGFGWEDNQSCRTAEGSGGESDKKDDSIYPECSTSGKDPDGDGYGFENGATCRVADADRNNGLIECKNPISDPDGDGYGWEDGKTCVADKKAKGEGGQGDLTVADITEVIVVTGQSNVAAAQTGFNAGLDQPNPRVFAYTSSGWQIADLHQVWDKNFAPGNNALNTLGRDPQNSFAFHFGKTVAGKSFGRVPAFIVAAAPGRGIAHWDYNSAFYRELATKVRTALQAIPHKFSVDAVLWHQGENDWLYEGTADAGATGFTSQNSNEYRNYYAIKLDSLIKNFRNEWGRGDTAFICAETRRAEGVNRRLMALNSDSDPLTGCVPATDLPKRANDPYGSHFSAEGLRTLGGRYADLYLQMTGG